MTRIDAVTQVDVPPAVASLSEPETERRPLLPDWCFSRRRRVQVALLAFVVLTLLAIGPLQPFDLALHRPWADLFTPNRVQLLRSTADKVAGQRVDTTVLVLVAILGVVRAKCWNPLVYVGAATIGFYAVGVVKIAFSRDSVAVGAGAEFFRGFSADLLHGQLGHVEKFVMAYPSGHSSEAILMYGTTYAVLSTYVGLGPRGLLVARLAWAAVVLDAVAVSFYLAQHWVTDLVAGLLLGWVLLELVEHVAGRVPRLGLDPRSWATSRSGRLRQDSNL